MTDDILQAIRREAEIRAKLGIHEDMLDMLLERKRENAIKTAGSVLEILKVMELPEEAKRKTGKPKFCLKCHVSCLLGRLV